MTEDKPAAGGASTEPPAPSSEMINLAELGLRELSDEVRARLKTREEGAAMELVRPHGYPMQLRVVKIIGP
jgi:hypothetical protein